MEEKIYKYLPRRIAIIIRSLPSKILENATEIRLRLNQPVSLSCGIKNYTFDNQGNICRIENACVSDGLEMKECLSLISRSSIYTFDETIRNGYIPLENGARAGVCGSAVVDRDGIKTFDVITSISIRIHRLYKDIAAELTEFFKEKEIRGSLVFSPPGFGKTTYLRSAAYLLSRGKNPLRVGIADEKREIFIPGMEGGLIDVIGGCKKQTGLDLLTKTMSPQILVCDEIGESESAAVINAQNSGVCLLASVHGESLEGIKKRPFAAKMIESGIFGLGVRLFYENGYKSELVDL